MNHSKEIGANLGESGRDIVSIVSCLSLIFSAHSATGIPTLDLVRLNKSRNKHYLCWAAHVAGCSPWVSRGMVGAENTK